ncbi:uncharacterized protein LOC131668383 [Phymastichus coffea]|uniref:uncharacterized protein LOC131668383 n=1 Tax=Phymastichus coffea TaxID=108790 RepID=UPI00273AEA7D|nr:uncharacterized protein LOC131668383 [Phymastichus coffea]
MRSIVVLCSLVAMVCVSNGSIEAKPELRQKRALYQEYCPPTMTPEQCKSYAEEKHKTSKECIRAEVSGLHIEWADCGSTICGENTRPVPADLSKSYPDCCPTCEVIDPTKEATMSQIGK